MTRRANDWYPTTAWATEDLLRHVDIRGAILEPCVGDRSIANVLSERLGGTVYTNDIDRRWSAHEHADATDPKWWAEVLQAQAIDWVVTNPPFNVAAEILPLAFKRARVGVAMLLRLTYLEPV